MIFICFVNLNFLIGFVNVFLLKVKANRVCVKRKYQDCFLCAEGIQVSLAAHTKTNKEIRAAFTPLPDCLFSNKGYSFVVAHPLLVGAWGGRNHGNSLGYNYALCACMQAFTKTSVVALPMRRRDKSCFPCAAKGVSQGIQSKILITVVFPSQPCLKRKI